MTTVVMSSHWLHERKAAFRSVCPQSVLNWREERYYAKYGEVELHVVRYLCRPDRDAIDIGANNGCYIHFLRKHARRVYAFEPLPWLADDLARKFHSDIEQRKVTIWNMALSNARGTSTLRVPIVDGVLVEGCASVAPEIATKYPRHRDITVRMETLDDVYTGDYTGDVGFIKIDVEGHEEAVLEGARKTIIRCRPRLLVELEESIVPGAVRRVTEFLAGLGYQGYFIYQRQLLPVDRFDPAIMQNPADYPDLKAGLDKRERFGRYIYNLLFFPPGERPETLNRIENCIAFL
jgi:FkbM family methyltransferase